MDGHIPDSVWARGSSNSGGRLLYISICSHLHHIIITSSSHLHILSSSHLHHTFITSSSHFLMFSSSHLLIFTFSPSLSLSSHLHIFSSSHLHHIFSSSHLHIFTLSPSLSLSFSLLALCHGLSPSFSLLSLGRERCQRGATKWPPFRTKWAWEWVRIYQIDVSKTREVLRTRGFWYVW